ncbi:MAG: UDP-N-acetylmuramate dehydrogenase [Chlamydiota bacterium]
MTLPLFQPHKLLKEVSTFGIGGPARLFTVVSTVEEMQAALRYSFLEKIPFFVLGKGSNCLFDDRGFDGLVIQNKISYLNIEENLVDVGSGYSFSMLGLKTAKSHLSGLEFASGIPATVGGCVFMNAGANGSETSEHLKEVFFVDEEGSLHSFAKKDLTFSYRYSSFQGMKGAIVSAKFVLTPSLTARDKQFSIIEYRKNTQPYQDPSAGCVFKNPEGTSAGALIEKSGLKGFSVGGAEVSRIHANFIVNKGGSSAQDVLNLAREVERLVKDSTGINLEMEIRCIPYQLL